MSILIKGMEMYEELVKRLRNISNSDSNIKSNYIGLTMIQAADAIGELSKQVELEHQSGFADGQIAANRKKPRWIPVAERLPENVCPVLVTYLGYNDKLPKSDMVALCDDGDWYWYDDESKCKVIVTHWMQLPEPPKEET